LLQILGCVLLGVTAFNENELALLVIAVSSLLGAAFLFALAHIVQDVHDMKRIFIDFGADGEDDIMDY
jgi:hypothetical protein